jgi:hypothetical protein
VTLQDLVTSEVQARRKFGDAWVATAGLETALLSGAGGPEPFDLNED